MRDNTFEQDYTPDYMMEQYISDDLLGSEVVLWCCQSKRDKKRHLPSVLNPSMELVAAIPLIIFGIIAIIVGLNIEYWLPFFAAAGAAIFIGMRRLVNIDRHSSVFYYLTDRRIIILRRSDKKRIVRAQNIEDISNVWASKNINGMRRVNFNPPQNINVYEAKNDMTERDIKLHAPMTFMYAYNVEEFISVLRMHGHIDIDMR